MTIYKIDNQKMSREQIEAEGYQIIEECKSGNLVIEQHEFKKIAKVFSAEKTSQEQAMERGAYLGTRILTSLAEIEKNMQDNFSLSDMDWADVGSLGHVAEKLDDICEFLGC